MQTQNTDSNFLILTAHDFRTPRWASIHFIAEQLAKQGKVRFFSLRYSLLSKGRPDSRHGAGIKANRVKSYKGVDCYLWKTLLHPLNFRRKFLEPLESHLYRLYVWCAPPVLKQWIRAAETIFIESGTGLVFYPLIKKLNPRARIVYLCSDTLRSIHCAHYVREVLYRFSPEFDTCIVCSRQMTEDFAAQAKIYFVPHGIDASLDSVEIVSPYGDGIQAVSVGSMLFDASFFEIAGHLFPDITFHVIGCGVERPTSWPNNVRCYDEMKFTDTIPFIKYAAIGIAPYQGSDVPPSLADTSMKMMQYAFFGVPTVCPVEVVGAYQHRFGYKTGDAESISSAIKAALLAKHATNSDRPLTWEQVTERILNPSAYPDTAL